MPACSSAAPEEKAKWQAALAMICDPTPLTAQLRAVWEKEFVPLEPDIYALMCKYDPAKRATLEDQPRARVLNLRSFDRRLCAHTLSTPSFKPRVSGAPRCFRRVCTSGACTLVLLALTKPCTSRKPWHTVSYTCTVRTAADLWHSKSQPPSHTAAPVYRRPTPSTPNVATWTNFQLKYFVHLLSIVDLTGSTTMSRSPTTCWCATLTNVPRRP